MRGKLLAAGYWLAVSVALLITASLAAEAAFWATGRGGSVTCGEDGWRWGLMHLVLGGPMMLFGYIVGLILFIFLRVRIRVRTMTVLGYSFGLQIIMALVVLIIFEWPNVFYRPPLCE